MGTGTRKMSQESDWCLETVKSIRHCFLTLEMMYCLPIGTALAVWACKLLLAGLGDESRLFSELLNETVMGGAMRNDVMNKVMLHR